MSKRSHAVPAELDRRTLLARTGVVAGTALITSVVTPGIAAASVIDTNPDHFPPSDPTAGSFASYRTVGPVVYDVVAVGAAGGGGQPGQSTGPITLPPGYGGATGATLTARISVPAGVLLTIVRGSGGKAGTPTSGGAGGTAYTQGSGGAGALGGGGGGALSGLYANGLPIILAGGGGGGAAQMTGQEVPDALGTGGGGGKATTTSGGGQDGQDGTAGGGGGGGSNGGAGGATPNSTGQGGTAFVASGPVAGVTIQTWSSQVGFINQTPLGEDGRDGRLTLTYIP